MNRDRCIFEAICRRAIYTKGGTVTIRAKSFGLTGHTARALITYLSELGCRRHRMGRAYKMICPKEVLDKLCQTYVQFFVRLKELGLY
jgi:hypothetical protein